MNEHEAGAVVYDVAIIGGGVVGCAIARELSKYALRCILIEASPDVGTGTSKANTAILHTGFDAKPGSLELKLVRRGYELMNEYAPEAGIPLEKIGGLLVAWTQDEADALTNIRETAHQNGVTDVEFVTLEDLYKREPHLGKGAYAALEVPGESIICPFTPPLAFMTQAVMNGVELLRNSPVQSIVPSTSGNTVLHCPDQEIHCRFVVNAAGLYSDAINRMMGHDEFSVTPRRGELIVFDKMAKSLLQHIVMPVPSTVTKGVMVGPTVFGNILLGPTATDVDNKTATQTTDSGLQSIWDRGMDILPELATQEVTATYAGLRAATEDRDYQIHLHREQAYLCVGGIRSTGLSASMAIAEYAVEQLNSAGLVLNPKRDFQTVKMPNIGEAFPRPYQREELIASNPDYGTLVCHCERVSKGEILDACRAIVPAHDLDGLRRRTRAQMGRCQGFYCAAEVLSILIDHCNVTPSDLLHLEAQRETH